jgi:hypothetical protein
MMAVRLFVVDENNNDQPCSLAAVVIQDRYKQWYVETVLTIDDNTNSSDTSRAQYADILVCNRWMTSISICSNRRTHDEYEDMSERQHIDNVSRYEMKRDEQRLVIVDDVIESEREKKNERRKKNTTNNGECLVCR